MCDWSSSDSTKPLQEVLEDNAATPGLCYVCSYLVQGGDRQVGADPAAMAQGVSPGCPANNEGK
jgi:hypothetical protein